MKQPRRQVGLSAGLFLGYLLGIFLILRAIAEPFVVDFGNPENYKHDWGGPTIIGVLAVHMLPGLIALVLICLHLKSTLQGQKTPK